jgi:hypothetical protein
VKKKTHRARREIAHAGQGRAPRNLSRVQNEIVEEGGSRSLTEDAAAVSKGLGCRAGGFPSAPILFAPVIDRARIEH